MYYYNGAPNAERYYEYDMDAIVFEFLNMPAGIWLLQIPILIRLACSFFVGYYESGLPVRTWPENALHVRSGMILPLIVAFPWQLLEIPLRSVRQNPNTLDTLSSDGLFILICSVALLRIWHFLDDLWWFMEIFGYYSNVITFFVFGAIIENVLEFFWLMLPEFYCGDQLVRNVTHRHMLLDCWSNNCSLFTIDLESGNKSCYNETWWSLMHYNTRLTTTLSNATKVFGSPVLGANGTQMQVVSLVQAISDIAQLNLFHHFFIYTSTKGVGIGYGGATNCYEAIFVIFLFAGGQYFYNWKISGFIDTIALAGDAGRVDDEKQLGIVQTFCEMHDADDKAR